MLGRSCVASLGRVSSEFRDIFVAGELPVVADGSVRTGDMTLSDRVYRMG